MFSILPFHSTPKPVFQESLSSARYIKATPLIVSTNSNSINAAAVTGPVVRFARQISGHGYIVAAPSSYHEFTGPEPLTV